MDEMKRAYGGMLDVVGSPENMMILLNNDYSDSVIDFLINNKELETTHNEVYNFTIKV